MNYIPQRIQDACSSLWTAAIERISAYTYEPPVAETETGRIILKVNEYFERGKKLLQTKLSHRPYEDQKVFIQCIQLRKEGTDLAKGVDRFEMDQKLLYKIEAVSRRLMQFENFLIRNSLARDEPIEVDGRILRSGETLLDDTGFDQVVEFVKDFEVYAHGARQKDLADSLKMRSCGYKLIRVLLSYPDSHEWVVRMEAALQTFIEYEKRFEQIDISPQFFYGEKIFPGKSFLMSDPELTERGARLERARFEMEDPPKEVTKEVDLTAFHEFIEAIDPLYQYKI